MSKNDIKCPDCGKTLETDSLETKLKCPNCDSEIFIDNSENIKETNRVDNNVTSNKSSLFIEKLKLEIIQKINNLKSKKLLLPIVGFAVIILISLMLALFGSDDKANANEAAIPFSSEECQDENYKDILKELSEAGFINVETKEIDDLIFGWLTKDGAVENVTVDGNEEFSSDTYFPKDVKIIVSYHTFPKETANDEVEEKEEIKEVEDTLTFENNSELAAIFKVKDPGDPIIQEFIKKYTGRTIEFDAYIFDIWNASYYNAFNGETVIDKNKYEIFPQGGNYEDMDPNVFYGPNMFMEVSTYKFKGIFEKYLNIHIIAKVQGYEEKRQLLILEPTSITAR